MSQKCKFIQINLHHRKADSTPCQKLAAGKTDVALTQEPWVNGDQIRGLHNIRGMMFSAGPSIAPRFCIFLRNTICALPLSELCSRDVAVVKANYTRGRKKMEITVTSAYLT